MRLFANFIAFLLTCVVGVVVTIALGYDRPPMMIIMPIGIGIFGAANAIVQSIQNTPVGEEVSPILAEPEQDSPETPTADSSKADNTDETSKSRSAMAPADETRVDDALPIGKVVDGRLMLTKQELMTALGSEDKYANVVKVVVPESPMTPGAGAQDGVLVLSPESAVYYNGATDSALSIGTKGIQIKRHPVSGILTGLKIESLDGRKAEVAAGGSHYAVIAAWIADTEEEWKKVQLPWPPGWGLLVHEIVFGLCPSTALRWQMPYKGVVEGLDLLSGCTEEEISKFTSSFKLLPEKLEEFGVPKDSPIYIQTCLSRFRSTRNLIVGIGLAIAIPLLLIVWAYRGMGIIKSGGATLPLLAILGVYGAVAAFGQYRYSRQVQELRQRGAP